MTASNSLRKKIKAMQAFYGYTNKQVGIKLKMSERSYSRRLKDMTFRVADLFELEKLLHTKLIDSELHVPGQM